tara:strand:- start:1697 stop:2059 length:363 start_codon:yes stop_codon:yes gene_type:complete
MKKYTFNFVSEERFEENEFETMYEFMDDGKEDSKYAVVGKNIDDDGEGHMTIEGTYPDDQFSEDFGYPETDFDAYDISSAINELCSEFYVTLNGTFTIIEGEVSTTYNDNGEVVKDNESD